MSAAQHTPGPYRVEHVVNNPDMLAIYAPASDRVVATVNLSMPALKTLRSCQIYDTYLIAAAPDLIEALEIALTLIKGSGADEQALLENFGKQYAKKVLTIRAAIAKARGEA